MIIYHQKVIIYHQKTIISPQKCALNPQNSSVILPHLFNILTLKYDLHTFVKKCLFIRVVVCQRMPGLGGQTNFANASILGTFGHLRPSLEGMNDMPFLLTNFMMQGM